MAGEIIATDEFVAWYQELSQQEIETVTLAVDLLELHGLTLGHPHSSAIRESKVGGLRELRPKRGASPLRIFYKYDGRRDAVVLIGGDKSTDKRFYERMIPIAERIWRDYEKEQEEGL